MNQKITYSIIIGLFTFTVWFIIFICQQKKLTSNSSIVDAPVKLDSSLPDMTSKRNENEITGHKFSAIEEEFSGLINYGTPITANAVDSLGRPVTVILAESTIKKATSPPPEVPSGVPSDARPNKALSAGLYDTNFP